MSRKSITELKALLAANVPDNVTSLVTPAKVREVLDSILDTIKPSFASLYTSNPQAQTFTAAGSFLVFQTIGQMDSPEWSATTNNIHRDAVGQVATEFNFQMDVAMPADTTLTCTFYVNGNPTEYATVLDSIKNDVQTLSFSLVGFVRGSAPADYKIHIRANANRNCTIDTASFGCQNQITR